MRSCDTLFVIEGWTNLPLLRAFVTRLYDASDDGPLSVDFLSDTTEEPGRPPVTRAKYRMGGATVGLFVPGGKDEARQAARRLVVRHLQGQFPNLKIVVLIRDLETSEASALHQGLARQLREIADGEGAEFESLGSGPWLCRVQNVAVGQILLGDPSTPGNAAIEDHVLELLKYQSGRDPSDLTPVVGSHLNIDLNPKQQVLLAMVKDDYWTAAAGFYERAFAGASDEQLRSLAECIGFTELMRRITATPGDGFPPRIEYGAGSSRE